MAQTRRDESQSRPDKAGEPQGQARQTTPSHDHASGRGGIGDSVPRIDGLRYTKGLVRYSADLIPQTSLHLALVRSPHPRARLVAIDADAARAMEGVVAVIGGAEAASLCDPMPPALPFRPPHADRQVIGRCLAVDEVAYTAQPVVAVVAESIHQAEAAAESVVVRYEILDPVLDPDRALLADAPIVHPGWSSNIVAQDRIVAGDVDAAFQEADCVVRGEVVMHGSTAAPMETVCYIGDWDDRVGRLTMTGSFQNPHTTRWQIATALRMSEADVRVVAPAMGGGFGLKMAGHVEEGLVALLSRMLRRPVAYVENRRDNLLAHSREQRHVFEIAGMRDGRVVAFRNSFVADVGIVGPGNGWTMPMVTATVFPTVYDVANVEVSATLAATNAVPWQPIRGYGKEAANLVMERAIDSLARELRLDPALVRARNLLPSTALPRRLPSGLNVDSGDYPAALEGLKTLFGYDEWRARQQAARGTGYSIGIGLGFELTPEGGARPGAFPSGFETASIRMSPTGTVQVAIGVTSPGSGNETGIAQIVAGVLGLPPHAIRVLQGDTDVVPVGTGNASSRALLYGGPAAHLAAEDLRRKLAICAGNLLAVAPETISFADGFAIGPDGASVSLKDIALGVHTDPFRVGKGIDLPLEATRSFQPSNVQVVPDEKGRIATYSSFPYSVHAAAVALDEGTGVVKLLDFAAMHDCGVMVNPALVTGQLKGAIAMGVGAGLWEELTYTAGRALVADRFKTYLLPRSTDLPPLRIGHMCTPSPFHPLGMKGAGESGLGGSLAAVTNAVADALGAAAPSTTVVPATPPRLMALLSGSGTP